MLVVSVPRSVTSAAVDRLNDSSDNAKMVGMERSYAAENARELERMKALVSKLSDQDLGSMVNEYWTVAGVLGHMAFWDGRALFLAGKLQHDKTFTPPDTEPEDVDWINDSTRPLIHAIPPRQAAEVALRIAEDGRARRVSVPRARCEDRRQQPTESCSRPASR
jgi:hypothetical protein